MKKETHRISIILGVLFFISIIATAYTIYDLPIEIPIQLWILLILSILTGNLAFSIALNNIKEIIVYKERTLENTEITTQSFTSDTTIELTELKKLTSTGNELLIGGVKKLCKLLEAGQGAVYIIKQEEQKQWIELIGGYALSIAESTVIKYEMGEGLIGQCAVEEKMLYIDEVPEGYIKVISGLGTSSPRYLIITPIKKEEKTIGIIEIAAFKTITESQIKFVEEAALLLGDKA